MADAPKLFAGWSDRIALADSLRARGEPYADAVAEADRHIGHAPARRPPPTIAPLSDWLADLARVLGGDLDVPEPKVGLSCSRCTKVTVRFSYSDLVHALGDDLEIPALRFERSSPRPPKAAVAAPLT